MQLKPENIVLDKASKFALRIIRLHKYLADEKHEYVVSRKILDDGTEIGANVKAAQEAESHDGFIRDMSAALRRCSKTDFWLQLLFDSGYLGLEEFDSIDADNQELFRLLTAIVKTARGQR